MNHSVPMAALLTAVALTLGCGDTGGSGGASDLEALAGQIDVQDQANEAAAQQAAKDRTAADAQAKADRLAGAEASAVSADDMQRGQKLKGGGYLSTTLRAGIVAEQKLNLFQVQHALNLYHATNGHYPKTHEDFMKDIIQFNGIPLEPLQEPYEYWYNAEEGALYKRVKPEAADAAQAEADQAAADAAQ